MFTIGTFARLANVSVRTLRHYEEIDLLQPDAVDGATGYRSYRAQQIPRLHRIVVLRDLGLSLAEIRRVLDADLTHGELTDLLQERRSELEERIAGDQERLGRVEQRIRFIQLETSMALDLMIKHIPPTRVAQVRWSGTGIDWPEIVAFARTAAPLLLATLRHGDVSPAGPLFMHYLDAGDGLVPTLAAPIGSQHLTPTDQVEVAELPAIDAVVTVHHGGADHGIVGPIYGEMARFAENQGHRCLGFGRDHILAVEADTVVFELQLPIALDGSLPA